MKQDSKRRMKKSSYQGLVGSMKSVKYREINPDKHSKQCYKINASQYFDRDYLFLTKSFYHFKLKRKKKWARNISKKSWFQKEDTATRNVFQ